MWILRGVGGFASLLVHEINEVVRPVLVDGLRASLLVVEELDERLSRKGVTRSEQPLSVIPICAKALARSHSPRSLDDEEFHAFLQNFTNTTPFLIGLLRLSVLASLKLQKVDHDQARHNKQPGLAMVSLWVVIARFFGESRDFCFSRRQ
jgi:hypothetical protein